MENNDLQPLSIDDFARLTSVSPRTVRRLIDSGILTPVRIGSLWALAPRTLPAPLRAALSEDAAGPLLRLYEVAERLDCTPNHVRKLALVGSLRPIMIGASKRWSREAVEAHRTKELHHDGG